MGAFVDSLAQAIAVALETPALDSQMLLFSEISWPAGVLVIDHLIAGILMVTIFFGGVPSGIAGLLLAHTRGPRADRARCAIAAAMPHLLIFQVTSLLLAVLITLAVVFLEPAEYTQSVWAWYQLENVVISGPAVPAWRHMMREDLRVHLVRHVA